MQEDKHRLIQPLLNLNSDTSHRWDERTKGRAPHKPFLLLSILDGISEGWIDSNRIYPDHNLVDYFFSYWEKVMGTDRKTSVALPYYHMASEPFWELKYKSGENEFGYSPSWGGIKARIKYAEIDPDLFGLLTDARTRKEVRAKLLESYFGDATAAGIEGVSKENKLTFEYTGKILSLVAEPFHPNHTDLKKKYYRKAYSQVRDQGFSKAVRESYSYSCAVCRDKVVTPDGKALVEGAHIIPWHESNNDDPRNGLSLCRNHHWMFDHFMFTIREDFSIKISKWLKKDDIRVKDLNQMKNSELLLPDDTNLLPAKEALLYHADQFERVHKEWK